MSNKVSKRSHLSVTAKENMTFVAEKRIRRGDIIYKFEDKCSRQACRGSCRTTCAAPTRRVLLIRDMCASVKPRSQHTNWG